MYVRSPPRALRGNSSIVRPHQSFIIITIMSLVDLEAAAMKVSWVGKNSTRIKKIMVRRVFFLFF